MCVWLSCLALIICRCRFHVLLILCDGQVTSERETAEAIVEASNFPLAIVVVGVGDGPWDHVREPRKENVYAKVV